MPPLTDASPNPQRELQTPTGKRRSPESVENIRPRSNGQCYTPLEDRTKYYLAHTANMIRTTPTSVHTVSNSKIPRWSAFPSPRSETKPAGAKHIMSTAAHNISDHRSFDANPKPPKMEAREERSPFMLQGPQRSHVTKPSTRTASQSPGLYHDKPLPSTPILTVTSTSPVKPTRTLIDAQEMPLRVLQGTPEESEWPALTPMTPLTFSVLKDSVKESQNIDEDTRVDSPRETSAPILESKSKFVSVITRDHTAHTDISAGAAAMEKLKESHSTSSLVSPCRTPSLRDRISHGELIKNESGKVTGFTDFTSKHGSQYPESMKRTPSLRAARLSFESTKFRSPTPGAEKKDSVSSISQASMLNRNTSIRSLNTKSIKEAFERTFEPPILTPLATIDSPSKLPAENMETCTFSNVIGEDRATKNIHPSPPNLAAGRKIFDDAVSELAAMYQESFSEKPSERKTEGVSKLDLTSAEKPPISPPTASNEMRVKRLSRTASSNIDCGPLLTISGDADAIIYGRTDANDSPQPKTLSRTGNTAGGKSSTLTVAVGGDKAPSLEISRSRRLLRSGSPHAALLMTVARGSSSVESLESENEVNREARMLTEATYKRHESKEIEKSNADPNNDQPQPSSTTVATNQGLLGHFPEKISSKSSTKPKLNRRFPIRASSGLNEHARVTRQSHRAIVATTSRAASFSSSGKNSEASQIATPKSSASLGRKAMFHESLPESPSKNVSVRKKISNTTSKGNQPKRVSSAKLSAEFSCYDVIEDVETEKSYSNACATSKKPAKSTMELGASSSKPKGKASNSFLSIFPKRNDKTTNRKPSPSVNTMHVSPKIDKLDPKPTFSKKHSRIGDDEPRRLANINRNDGGDDRTEVQVITTGLRSRSSLPAIHTAPHEYRKSTILINQVLELSKTTKDEAEKAKFLSLVEIMLDVIKRTTESEQAKIRAEQAACEAKLLHEANLAAVNEMTRVVGACEPTDHRKKLVKLLKDVFISH